MNFLLPPRNSRPRIRRPTRSLCGLALCVLFAGCHRHPASGPPPPPGALQQTAHSEDLEFYLEHPPLVAGQAAQLVGHLSKLPSGIPWEGSNVRYQFRLGDTLVESPDLSPVQPGVYSHALVFPKAGDWRGLLLAGSRDQKSTLSFGPVRVHADAENAEAAPQPPPLEGILVSKERQWQLGIRTAPVVPQRLVSRVRAAGTVTAPPGATAHVSAPFPGTFLSPSNDIPPTLGESVTAGQILGRLRPAFSEATAKLGEIEGQIADAKLSVAQARRNLDRVRRLVELGIESRQDLELAQLGYEAAVARLEATLATRTSYRSGADPAGEIPLQELRAPISGRVVAGPSAAPGQYVPADQVLFTLLESGRIRIEARIPESAVQRLGADPDALLESPGRRGEFLSVATAGGRLVFASPLVDASTHTVTFVYELPNPDGRFRIGEHLNALLASQDAALRLAIPDAAIVEDGGQPVAFVQVAGETFERRELVLGLRDGNQVEVLSGLRSGERVVVAGANLVRLSGASTEVPAEGHVH
ncbi:MAG: efflux RND transporter periplasmic adaptor subunit [Verrucomicrobiae bacterium]|nr:efflux RND transporter periplasmic adaptor subunit [Verrucomicrobiae bacterium]